MRRLLIAAMALAALPGTAGASVISPTSLVAGISQSALADQWFRWIFETPNADNPLTNDPTGANAGVNNNGPVFLLAGSAGGGMISRTITVPGGRPLFFPLINTSDVELSPAVVSGLPPTIPPTTTCQGTLNPDACALAFITPAQSPAGLVATLNGTPLDPNLNSDYATYFQQSTGLQSVDLPAGNVFSASLGYPADSGAEFVQNGYYMAIDALQPGTYTLAFGGTDSTGVTYGAVDTLNVVPEPGSLVLFTIGIIAVGWTRRRYGVGR